MKREAVLGFFFAGLCGAGVQEIDRRCSLGDCVSLLVDAGRVIARQSGELSGGRDVGSLATAGTPLVPATEAPLRVASTRNGWRAVLTAYLPGEFSYAAPELRLHLFAPKSATETTSDQYNVLGTFRTGRLFDDIHEFVAVSATGEHSYVELARVWFLRDTGVPKLILDVSGTLFGIQRAGRGRPAGVWMRPPNL